MVININQYTFDIDDVNLIKFYKTEETKCNMVFVISPDRNIRIKKFEIERVNQLFEKIKEDFVKIQIVPINCEVAYFFINKKRVQFIENKEEKEVIKFVFNDGNSIIVALTNYEPIVTEMILNSIYGDGIFYVWDSQK